LNITLPRDQVTIGRSCLKGIMTPVTLTTLGPETLCREAATSHSQLYRLLDGEGGVARYIQRSRLTESFALLCDPSNGDSIGKVAELLCFADGSSFSRAFRREFGVSPSDTPAAALVGRPVMPPMSKAASGGPSFEECLYRL
jgi:AraC-like DNA-binding protein